MNYVTDDRSCIMNWMIYQRTNIGRIAGCCSNVEVRTLSDYAEHLDTLQKLISLQMERRRNG